MLNAAQNGLAARPQFEVGRVGGYAEELSAEDVAYVDHLVDEHLHPLYRDRYAP